MPQIKIYHSSDEHGSYLPLAEFAEANGPPDLWILTGDFFPNMTRGDANQEIPYQIGYFQASLPILKRAFKRVPILVQAGNHDYADLVSLLHKNLFDAYGVSETKSSITVGQDRIPVSYAGFRQIPYIAGEWNGETDYATLASLVDKVVGESPDLMINHAPPAGILDGEHYGIPALTSQLFYREHKIKAVLFGHVHRTSGAKVITVKDMVF